MIIIFSNFGHFCKFSFLSFFCIPNQTLEAIQMFSVEALIWTLQYILINYSISIFYVDPPMYFNYSINYLIYAWLLIFLCATFLQNLKIFKLLLNTKMVKKMISYTASFLGICRSFKIIHSNDCKLLVHTSCISLKFK